MSTITGILWSVFVSTTFAGLLYLGLRTKRMHPAWLLALGLFPVAAVYVAIPNNRVYSTHGFAHLGFVYRIAAGQIPPNSPLLGEARLHYPWLHHWTVAKVAEWSGTSPASIFAAINLLCLVASLVLLFRTALLLHGDRLAAIFAATFAIFGSTMFNVGPIATAAERLVGLKISEGRGLAILKFVRVNSMPIGFAFFALYLWSILRVFRKPGAARAGDYIVLAASVLGSGLYYPLTWLPLMASLFAACVAFAFQYGKDSRRTLLCVAGATIIAMVCLVPYMNSLRAGQDSLLSISDVSSLLGKGIRLSLGFSLVALLAWWERDVIRELLAREPGRLIALLSTVLTTAVMYVVVNAHRNEYKFLILSCLTLGILAGGLQAKVYRTRRALSFLILVACLIPASSDWIVLFRQRNMPITDPYVEQGTSLRHKTPGEDRLYQWIASQTSGDSLFIDSYLTIPVFGQRALYAGLDIRRESGPTPPNRDGWSTTAADNIGQEGHPRKLVKSRVEVSRRVLDPNLPITPADLSQLKQTMANQQVYIVARDPATREKLRADGRLQLAFASDAASVFLVPQVAANNRSAGQ